MKTAFITGANRSIGLETAKQLAEQGYFIFLGCRDMAKGEDAIAQLKEAGLPHVKAIQINISDAASVAAAREVVGQEITSLDVLINNAGILGGLEQPAVGADIAVIREVFETNFYGAISVTNSFLDMLQKSPEPRIVNVTSGLGSLTLHSDPSWKYYAVKTAAYGTSKTALNAYTVVLAYELRDTPFKVNAVDPGYTATDFNHHSGPGSVEDAAKIIVKYATLDADGPTGKFFSNDIEDDSQESPW